MPRNRIVLLSLLILFAIGTIVYLSPSSKTGEVIPGEQAFRGGALEETLENYGEEVLELAEDFDLSYEYLMALITLETSGKKPPGSRFEQGVYNRLLKVKTGEKHRYEQVKKQHLEDASDEAIRNLSTSWGPFQLMGYKCIGMEVNVADIRGDDGLYHGVLWIDDEYGKFIRKGHFDDAFHYHNTGRKYPLVGKPKTHDPRYVEKGLSYMEFFRQNKP